MIRVFLLARLPGGLLMVGLAQTSTDHPLTSLPTRKSFNVATLQISKPAYSPTVANDISGSRAKRLRASRAFFGKVSILRVMARQRDAHGC